MTRTVDLPPRTRRAAIAPTSVDLDARTAQVVWSTGAGVERRDLAGAYIEKLSLDPAHVKLDRMNRGAAPLLNSHRAYSMDDIVGAVVPGSVSVTPTAALATVRFSRREDVEPLFRDVADGIIRSVSVGYIVHTYSTERPQAGQTLPTRTATSWTPYELSLVAMPADAGAHVRGLEMHPCELLDVAAVRDADRLRRLRLATLRTVSETHAPRGSGPTAAHHQAVLEAVQKFTATGRFSAYSRLVATLPDFELRWDEHPDFASGRDVLGVTRLFTGDATTEIHLRSDLEPDVVHRVALHELQHLLDEPLVRQGRLTERQREERAETTERLLAAL